MPQYGDTRVVDCSWCYRRKVTEVYRPYPPGHVAGGYWDCSACPCGTLMGMVAMGRAVASMGRSANHEFNKRRAR